MGLPPKCFAKGNPTRSDISEYIYSTYIYIYELYIVILYIYIYLYKYGSNFFTIQVG